MTGITATEARSNPYRLIDETAESHQPIVIMGKRHKAALVSKEDGAALQETLYLLSVLGIWPPAVSNQTPRHRWRW
ncbi:type II toxin-antitoxin system Phd/YefM family antitoxin [Halomonas sp. DWK9]|uniref:type II toxin-antitoxin system Phd/YefM family antitoxin n=1 Tax=Halomonas sp. DWK9 TaxID=3060155 RepID=UPI00287F85E6|nr:type II toxin-antitoxin system Phd/YefM family antitoxin [Halomonas sp. DWK9]